MFHLGEKNVSRQTHRLEIEHITDLGPGIKPKILGHELKIGYRQKFGQYQPGNIQINKLKKKN